MRLNESLKRAIYSDIMNDVARVVKSRVNEDNNDDFVDLPVESFDKYKFRYFLTDSSNSRVVTIPTSSIKTASCILYILQVLFDRYKFQANRELVDQYSKLLKDESVKKQLRRYADPKTWNGSSVEKVVDYFVEHFDRR